MSWREQRGRVEINGRQVVGATYRGVPFFVESAERGGGRRTVTKEFPLRDKPLVEDLGRAARVFPVEGYVLGDDYLTQRDALLDALENAAGPGQLVHPTYGVLQVICTSFRVRETQRDGGFATFSIEFTETEELPKNPSVTADATALMASSADAAVEASAADFVASYTVDGEPGWTVAELAAVLTAASDAIDEQLSPVMATAEALAALKSQLADLESDALALARRPQQLADQFAALLVSLADPLLLPRLISLYSFEPPARPLDGTATRAKEQANYDLLLALLRRGFVIQAARLAPLQEFDSYEEALEVRDQLADALDEQLEVAGDDAYPGLQQLRADLVRAVPGEDSELAHLVAYTPPASVPSLVLAYRLYGSLELEQDLIDRNHIQNPAFIRGGSELEVLSHG